MEKAFDIQKCRDDEKIRFAAYLLQGKMFNWYQRLEHKYEQEGEKFTWKRFRGIFHDQYFLQSIRIQKEQEFIYLK